ncbi:DUF4259 domain-containing protein [Actinacidiphila soli]|uniref:DUF4259 domain-containing protein n=1 Tax=Actinacidiphila soli TaxID=2487275 RepID=UPI000FCB777A|nr:DUF4259 domain-containing protein [Actinacidiphila soli]
MGTWGISPFENDTAGDFAITLDETAPEGREVLVRAMLVRAVEARDYLDSEDGQEAVAAAALVAAQCPGGEPITGCGPEQALPAFAADLRLLAAQALDRVAGAASELAELWNDTRDRLQWRQSTRRLRLVLAPDPGPQTETLFEL